MDAIEVFLADGSTLSIPRDVVAVWQFEVSNLHTYRGLADWHQHEMEEGDS